MQQQQEGNAEIKKSQCKALGLDADETQSKSVCSRTRLASRSQNDCVGWLAPSADEYGKLGTRCITRCFS